MKETGLIVTEQESIKPPKLEKPKPAVVILDDVVVKGTTQRALLCVIPNFGETWIPKSQIREGNEISQCGDFGRLVITSWLAKKKGLLAA